VWSVKRTTGRLAQEGEIIGCMDLTPEEQARRLQKLMLRAENYFLCPNCGAQITKSDTWLDEHETDTCESCGRLIDFNDLEDVWEPFFYLAPAILCHQCRSPIELPYSNLPQVQIRSDGELRLLAGDPPELPPEEWSATFGCRTCGHVTTYAGRAATTVPIQKWKEGSFQSGRGVYRAEFPCGDTRCKAPASMYVDIGEGNANDVIQLLRSAHVQWTLPCGHEIRAAPERYYKISPVMRRMW
jgi:predicted RNA-binding Zn-ribbon protein involved in translation (DUF1610 family)